MVGLWLDFSSAQTGTVMSSWAQLRNSLNLQVRRELRRIVNNKWWAAEESFFQFKFKLYVIFKQDLSLCLCLRYFLSGWTQSPGSGHDPRSPRGVHRGGSRHSGGWTGIWSGQLMKVFELMDSSRAWSYGQFCPLVISSLSA